MDLLTIMNNAPSGSALLKALKNDDYSLHEPKSAIIDPMNVLNYTGTRAKPTSMMPLRTLRNMAYVPAISAIIRTRLNQVARFARQPRFEGDIGFRIVTKDMEQKMSPADKKEANRISKLLMDTGMVKNRIRKDNFDSFLRKITRDSLTLDQMCWENVPSVGGGLAEFWALDATTIELVCQEPTSEMYDLPVYQPMTKKGRAIEGEIVYVQRIQGQIVAEYTEDELCFAVRNPLTDIQLAPFGRSELEDIVEIVTGIVNGLRYNTSYFNHSSLPQGVLELIGTYKDEHLEAFRRMWKTMTSGAAGKWAVPVMAMTAGQGFKWTPFKNSNRDMEFNQFMEFLFNVACSVYQIDPNEVGFKSWTSGRSTLGQSDNTAEKIANSQDKGLIPLMTFLGQALTSEIIDQVNDEFCLSWEGLDADLEQITWNRAKEELQAGTLLVNEYRAVKNRDMISQDWAEEAPGNPQLIQVYMAGKQAEQQQQQMAMQGEQQQQQAEMQNDHQLNQLQQQHKNSKEMAGLQHGNAKEMATLQQQHELTKQGNDQAFQKQNGAVDRWHEQNMADDAHGKAKEMAKMSHTQQKELQKDGQKHEMGMSVKQHERAKEIQKDGQKYQSDMADKRHEQGRKTASEAHSRTKELAKDAHTRTKELATDAHRNAQELARNGHEHNKDMANHNNRLKRSGESFSDNLFDTKPKRGKLQKSLSDIYLADHPLVERLAEAVHEAWMKSAGTADNPDMGEYDELHEAVKETDRACARAVIEELLKAGIIPDEDKLKKAIELSEFEETCDGTVITINPWDTY